MSVPARLKRAERRLRDVALGYPEAVEDHPWDETVFKVRGKIFVFLGVIDGDVLRLNMKLPASHPVALMQPFAQPAGYGLGRAGWVRCEFRSGDDVPVEMLSDWIDESYRAVAPKRLVAAMPAQGNGER